MTKLDFFTLAKTAANCERPDVSWEPRLELCTQCKWSISAAERTRKVMCRWKLHGMRSATSIWIVVQDSKGVCEECTHWHETFRGYKGGALFIPCSLFSALCESETVPFQLCIWANWSSTSESLHTKQDPFLPFSFSVLFQLVTCSICRILLGSTLTDCFSLSGNNKLHIIQRISKWVHRELQKRTVFSNTCSFNHNECDFLEACKIFLFCSLYQTKILTT